MLFTGNMVWIHTKPRCGGTVGNGRGEVGYLTFIVALWEASCLTRVGEFPGKLGVCSVEGNNLTVQMIFTKAHSNAPKTWVLNRRVR